MLQWIYKKKNHRNEKRRPGQYIKTTPHRPQWWIIIETASSVPFHHFPRFSFDFIFFFFSQLAGLTIVAIRASIGKFAVTRKTRVRAAFVTLPVLVLQATTFVQSTKYWIIHRPSQCTRRRIARRFMVILWFWWSVHSHKRWPFINRRPKKN